MFNDEQEEELATNVGRYPCMPSLIALQQMRNRLYLARTGRKLMKWTTIATSKELRVLAEEIIAVSANYREVTRDLYILLARARFFCPNLNDIVVENIPVVAPVTVKHHYRSVVGCKLIQIEPHDKRVDGYEHLGLSNGGSAILEVKKAWKALVIRLVSLASLRMSFLAMEAANASSIKKENILKKVLIPKLVETSKYIICELDEKEREDNFRLKRFKQLKIKRAAIKAGEQKIQLTIVAEEIEESMHVDESLLPKELPEELPKESPEELPEQLPKELPEEITTEKIDEIIGAEDGYLPPKPVQESIVVLAKIVEQITPCGICKPGVKDVDSKHAYIGDNADLGWKAYHTKAPSLTEIAKIYVPGHSLGLGELDTHHHPRDKIHEYYKAPPLSDLCNVYLKGLVPLKTEADNINPYYSKIPSLTKFFEIYLEKKEPVEAIVPIESNKLIQAEEPTKAKKHAEIKEITKTKELTEVKVSTEPEIPCIGPCLYTKPLSAQEENDMLYFEKKYKEIIKLKTKKNIDGSICEEKQLITIRTERKNTEKAANTSMNKDISSPCCEFDECKNDDQDHISIKTKSDCLSHIHQMGDPAARSCKSCEYEIVTDTYSDILQSLDVVPRKSNEVLPCTSCEENLVWQPIRSPAISCECPESLIWTPESSKFHMPCKPSNSLSCKSCEDNHNSFSCQFCEGSLVWAPKRIKNTSSQYVWCPEQSNKATSYESMNEENHIWNRIKSKKITYCKSCYDNYLRSKSKSESQISSTSADEKLVWTPKKSRLQSCSKDKDFMWLNTVMINETNMWPCSAKISSNTSYSCNSCKQQLKPTKQLSYSGQNNSGWTSNTSNNADLYQAWKEDGLITAVKSELTCKSCHENLIWTPIISKTSLSCKSCEGNPIWTPQKSKTSLSCKSCEENFVWTSNRSKTNLSCSSCERNLILNSTKSKTTQSCKSFGENVGWTPTRLETALSCSTYEQNYTSIQNEPEMKFSSDEDDIIITTNVPKCIRTCQLCKKKPLLSPKPSKNTLSCESCKGHFVWTPNESKTTLSHKSSHENLVWTPKKSRKSRSFESHTNISASTSKLSQNALPIWTSKKAKSTIYCKPCDENITWIPKQNNMAQTYQASNEKLVMNKNIFANPFFTSHQDLSCYPKDAKHLLSGNQILLRKSPKRSENTLSSKKNFTYTSESSISSLSCHENLTWTPKQSKNYFPSCNSSESKKIPCVLCQEKRNPNDRKKCFLSGDQGPAWTHTLMIDRECIWPERQYSKTNESEVLLSYQSCDQNISIPRRSNSIMISCQSYHESLSSPSKTETELARQLFVDNSTWQPQMTKTSSYESESSDKCITVSSDNKFSDVENTYWTNTLWVDNNNLWPIECQTASPYQIRYQSDVIMQKSSEATSCELCPTKFTSFPKIHSSQRYQASISSLKSSKTKFSCESCNENNEWTPKKSLKILSCQSPQEVKDLTTNTSRTTASYKNCDENLVSTTNRSENAISYKSFKGENSSNVCSQHLIWIPNRSINTLSHKSCENMLVCTPTMYKRESSCHLCLKNFTWMPKLSKTTSLKKHGDKYAWMPKKSISEVLRQSHQNDQNTMRYKNGSSCNSRLDESLWIPNTLSCRSCEEIRCRDPNESATETSCNVSHENLIWTSKQLEDRKYFI